MSRSITVCHVNLAKGYRGGERQTELLIKEMSRHPSQYEVCAVFRKDGILEKKIATLFPEIRIITVTNPLLGHISARLKLHPDVTHAHEARSVYWCWLFWLMFAKPFVITRRVQDPIKNKFFLNHAYRHAKSVVSVSSWISRHIMERFPSISPITILDTTEWTPSRTWVCRPADSKRPIRLAHAGAIKFSHKGQDIAIEVLHQLPGRFHLTLYGDGPDKEKLIQIVKEAELDHRVNIQPWNTFELDALAQFDCFIFTSRHEGLGSILIDVMKSGLPIVAADVGGVCDLIIEGKTGKLVQVTPSFTQDFAKSILELYRNKSLAENLSLTAKKTAAHLTPATMLRRYSTLYSSHETLRQM